MLFRPDDRFFSNSLTSARISEESDFAAFARTFAQALSRVGILQTMRDSALVWAGLTGKLTRPYQRAIRIRHGATPDLSVSREPRIDGIIVARCSTAMQPARQDENEAGQNCGGDRQSPGTFLLATLFTTLISNFSVFDPAGNLQRTRPASPN